MSAKEEIVNRVFKKGFFYEFEMEFVFQIMDEYAKQECIAFAEWKFNEGIYEGFNENGNDYKYFYLGGEGAAKDAEQLYLMFEQQTQLLNNG